MRTISDPYATSKWQDAKKQLLTELDLVKDLSREVQAISGSAGPGSMAQKFGSEVRDLSDFRVPCFHANRNHKYG